MEEEKQRKRGLSKSQLKKEKKDDHEREMTPAPGTGFHDAQVT